jgi:hypothetical protein
MSSPAHGRWMCSHLNQSQRSLNARAKCSKSRMPRPPRSLGAQVVSQLTRQCPPLTFPVPLLSRGNSVAFYQFVVSTTFASGELLSGISVVLM